MKYATIIITLLTLTSCGRQMDVTDSVQVGRFSLDLINENETAYLLYTDSSNDQSKVALDIAPPCYFLRKDGALQTYAYPEEEINHVVIAIGNIANKDEKERYGVFEDKVCGKKIQGILIGKGTELHVTDKVISGALSCRNNGLDEKDFWDFAHN